MGLPQSAVAATSCGDHFLTVPVVFVQIISTMFRASIVFVVALGLAWPWPALAVNPPPLNGGGVANLDLKTQLEKGLRARRPVEFAYIAQIVALVESGDLPESLVTSTFVWARKKPTRRLQYFQFALQTRAKKLHVQLPDLRGQAAGVIDNGAQSPAAPQ
jgi:hypothetical protein